ncbi:MAG: hypothetical protein ACPGQV_02130 [Alphaproteobacteria bacterium]
MHSASAQSSLVTECAQRKDHRAIEICRLAAEQNADDPKVSKLLAKTLIRHGAFAEASEVQGTIVQLRPDDWAAQYDYAGTLGFVRRSSARQRRVRITYPHINRPPSSSR